MRQREKVQEVLRKTHRLIPIAIVLFWLTMMALLTYREVVAPRMHALSVTRRTDGPTDLWMGIYTGSRRIGFVNARSNPGIHEGESGVHFGLTARLEVSMFDRAAVLALSGTGWLSSTRGLSEFDFIFRSGAHELRAEGRVHGGVIEATLHTAGETSPLRLPVGRDLVLGGGMGLPSIDVPLLEPGQVLYVDSFDPATMAVGKAKLECVGKETIDVNGEATETSVIATSIAGITTKAWVTAQQEVVRAETPFGFTLKKITAEEALAPADAGEKASLIRTLAIRPIGATPKRGITMMRLRFSGIPDEQLPPSNPVQTRGPAGYIITVPDPVDTPSSGPLSAEEQAAYLASDAFVASKHPKIQRVARAAVGNETDPWKQALALHEWVYRTIRKSPVLSIPTALDVLRTGEGDCNEHAVLFTAMARAAGIPTRIAIGLAWSEHLGAFGYHAWVEVFAGKWIPMDPTFGQAVADATHIKLRNGGIDQWAQLLPYIGRLQIEVLSVE